MDKRHCLKIARRISTMLNERLGQGVDAQRMVEVPLYARDVLLVCEAMEDAECSQLARMFRQSLLDAASAPSVTEPGGISSMLNSFFGPTTGPGSLPDTQPPPTRHRVWRWFGRGERAGGQPAE